MSTTQNASAMSAAQENISAYARVGANLISNGYSAIPIDPTGKRPDPCLGMEWQRFCNRLPTQLEIDVWSKRPVGVGIALGAASRGLIAIDIDSEDLDVIEAIESRWPSTVRKVGRTGYTAFYWASPAVKSRAYKSGSHGGVDFLAHGRQSVLPPSRHPVTGEAYRWLTPRTLETTIIDELPMLPDDIAAQLAEALEPFGFEAQPERQAFVRSATDDDSEWRETNETALANLTHGLPILASAPDARAHRGAVTRARMATASPSAFTRRALRTSSRAKAIRPSTSWQRLRVSNRAKPCACCARSSAFISSRSCRGFTSPSAKAACGQC